MWHVVCLVSILIEVKKVLITSWMFSFGKPDIFLKGRRIRDPHLLFNVLLGIYQHLLFLIHYLLWRTTLNRYVRLSFPVMGICPDNDGKSNH